MAKVSLTKLNLIKEVPMKEVSGIEFKQYLKIADKLQLMANVIESAGDEAGYFNIVKLDVFYKIFMLKEYSNINLTDKILEDPTKLYDIICLNHIWDAAEVGIPEDERTYIWNNIVELAKSSTAYDSSVLGILKTIKSDYSNTQFDVDEIAKAISDPEQLNFIKGIIENNL